MGTPEGFVYEAWDLGANDGSYIPHSEEFGNVFNRELDLDNSVLSVVKGEELFLFKTRVYNDARRMDYFLLYKYALGILDERKGTFYGAAAYLVDQRVDVKTMIDVLRGLAGVVEKCCIENDRFVQGLSAAESSLDELLKESASIKAVLRTVNPLAGSEKKPRISTAKPEFVFVEEPHRLDEFAAYKYSERLAALGPDVYFSSSLTIKQQAEQSHRKNKLTVVAYPPLLANIKTVPLGNAPILAYRDGWKKAFMTGCWVAVFITFSVLFLEINEINTQVNYIRKKLYMLEEAFNEKPIQMSGTPLRPPRPDPAKDAGGEPDASILNCQPETAVGVYFVKPGDTLDGVTAAKCYNGKCTAYERLLYMQKIRNMNNLESDDFKVGQKLKLPICRNY